MIQGQKGCRKSQCNNPRNARLVELVDKVLGAGSGVRKNDLAGSDAERALGIGKKTLAFVKLHTLGQGADRVLQGALLGCSFFPFTRD